MFLDLGESNILRPYMSDAIIDISKVCEAFEAKEAAPSVAGMERGISVYFFSFFVLTYNGSIPYDANY